MLLRRRKSGRKGESGYVDANRAGTRWSLSKASAVSTIKRGEGENIRGETAPLRKFQILSKNRLPEVEKRVGREKPSSVR